MKILDSNIIAFTRDGKIINFDDRAEFDNCDFRKLNICHIIASPQDLYRRFKELEDKVDELEKQIEQQEY